MGLEQELRAVRVLRRRAAGADDPGRRQPHARDGDGAQLGDAGHFTAKGAVHKRRDGGSFCDASAGRWVRDPTGPAYTSLTCPTLPDSKNCHKYGKDPGHFQWRWQPDGCDLPRSSPELFLAAVRGRQLAFIGDSLARNQMESLLCLLSQAETPTKVLAGDADGGGVLEWRFPAHGFTFMAITTRFLARGEAVVGVDGKPTASFDVHLDEPDPAWASRLRGLDYAVFSGGNWLFRVNYFSEGGRRVGCSGCDDRGRGHGRKEQRRRAGTRPSGGS
uniref:Uncharacterized protein n=1 Tax=Oryza brachyantha TaxID=4533 RepID=J3MCR2_ORYBR